MSHLKNKVARRTARLTSVLLAVLMILTVAPIIAFPASAADTTPYRIVHLDCGRKYFSVANIKKLIDTMAQYGYNQLQLAFGNGGCRFLLDDMDLSYGDFTMDGSTVKTNITKGNEAFNGDTRYLTEAEMTAIITYANAKNIEIVPMLNMPGHMEAILSQFAGYKDSNGNLDLDNTEACNFAYALLKKYVDYFAGNGCSFFHFGADESKHTGDPMTKFLTKCAEIITGAEMTPRAFNDATGVATMPKSVQVTYWHKETNSQYASTLESAGYEMINTHGRWYYVIKTAQNSEIGTKYWQGTVNTSATSVELPTLKAEKMDNKWVGINEYFDGNPGYGSTISGSLGSMFCIWCDASQDAYLTDSDVISENENYGALYQIEKLAEHYWPDDIKKEETTKPTVTVSDGTAVPSQITNGISLTLKSDKSVTWTTSNPSVIDLLNPANSESITGTTVTLVAKGTGTATITATDSSGNAVSYTITVNDSTSGSDTVKNVKLTVGGSETITIADGITAGSYISGNDSYIATAEVAQGTAQAASVKAVTSITTGKKYLITMGNYVVTNNYTSTTNFGETAYGLTITGMTIDADNIAALLPYSWTFTASGSNRYTVVDANGKYLSIDSNSSVTLSDSEKILNVTDYNGLFAFSNDNSIYLDNFGGISHTYYNTLASAWATANPAYNNKWTLYEIVEGSSGNSTLTITGTGEGDTSVTVGNVTYNIKVTAPTFTESKALTYGTSFSLPSGAEAQITSGENCVTLTENNTKITAGQTDGNATVEAVVKNAGGKVTARYTYNITVSSIDFDAIATLPVQLWITNTWVGADSAPTSLQTVNVAAKSAYKEEGVLLSEFVPASGYKKDGSNTVRVTYWKGVALHNGIEPVQQGTDYSNSGDAFLRIRYWNGAWQYLNGTEWTSIVTNDTIVAYYLQLNNVSNEITTGTQHYGNPPTAHPGNNSGNGYNMTAFAVVYPDGTLSRTEQEMYEAGMIRGFWGGTTTNIGTIYAENNSIYKISKITLTWGKNKLGTSGDNWYAGNKTGTYGTDWGVEWEKETNSAGQDWYKETTYWKAGDSEIPMIDGETLGLNLTPEKNAALILIYLEVVQTEDTLSVIYWDDNADAQITTNPMPIPIVVDNGITFLKIKQSSTVHVGEFTLDDNAYIVNSSGANQGFNKEISTVPGVTGVYLSGMYKYSKAEISEDGKTLKLHFNLKNADNQKTYVVDFGLPLVIKASDFEITELHAISSVSLEKGRITTEQTGTFGTAIIANDWSKVTYRLNKILTGKATIPLYVTFTDGAVKLFNAHIIPASTMYYEENFVTPTNAGATDNGAWTLDGTRKSAEQTLSELGSRDRYGFDSAYENGLTYSMGSAWKTTVNGTTYSKNNGWPTITFTFKGTGFDIISLTDNTSGTIIVEVKNSAGYAVKTMLVNNYYSQADGLYQIPVIKAENLSYDEYTVTIIVAYSKLFDTNNRGSYTFCLDAVRIYNTLGTGSDVDAVYANDGEAAPTFTEIRDITSAADFDVNAQGVFVDGDPNAKYDTYQRLGPNHEIYLARGQAIAFNVSLEDGQHLFIGAKSPNGGAVMNINDGAKTVAINTATDMYYEITPKDGRVIILNTGDNILSLTTIKITSDPATTTQNSVEFSVDENLLVYARATAYAIMHPFAPEHFEANWTTVKLFRKSIHTLTVRTSTDVDYITVDGEKVTTFYYSVALEGWGWNRKFVKYKVFTVSLDDDAELGDYEVIAYNADGEASEPHIATLTGKVGVGKFN